MRRFLVGLTKSLVCCFGLATTACSSFFDSIGFDPETRDHVASIAFSEDCYTVSKEDPATVIVQALSERGTGLNGVKLSWNVLPDLLPKPAQSTTSSGTIGSFKGEGVVTLTITFPAEAPMTLPATAVLTVATASDDELVSASAELHLSAEAADLCKAADPAPTAGR